MGDDDKSIRRGYQWDHVRVPVEVVLDERDYDEPQDDGSTRSFRLGVNEKALYLVLALHADWASGVCFPSLDRLARLLDLTRPTVIKAIKRLELAGLLESSHRNDAKGRRQSNLYILYRGQPLTPDSTPTETPTEPPQVKLFDSVPQSPSKESLPGTVKNLYTNLTMSNVTETEPKHGVPAAPEVVDVKEQSKARRRDLWDKVLAYFKLPSVEAIPVPVVGKWRVAVNKGLFDQGVTGDEFIKLADRLKTTQPWRALTDPMVIVSMLPYLRSDPTSPNLRVVRPPTRTRAVDGSPHNQSNRMREAAEETRRKYADYPDDHLERDECNASLPGL